MSILFLDANNLGLLLPAFQKIELANTKKQRATAFKNYIKVLKGLGMLITTWDVISLSLGYEQDGTRGLFIIYKETGTKVLGQTGPKGEVK